LISFIINNMYYVYAYLRAKESERGPIGSPYYIGKGKGLRAYSHSRSGRKPPRDRSQIVILSDNLSEEEAFAKEKALIAFYGRVSTGGCLHNLTDGGEGVAGATWKRNPLTPQQLANMSAAHKGKGHPQTEKAKQKIRETLTGIKHAPERVAKMAASRRGQRVSPATEFKRGQPMPRHIVEASAAARRGKPCTNIHALVGRKHTADARIKMSLKLKAAWERRKANGPVYQSAETKAKIAAALRATRAAGKVAA